MNGSVSYGGNELELFARAVTWKAYIKRRISRYIHGQVLEVGAGQGATTAVLCEGFHDLWLCLEPDRSLASRIQDKLNEAMIPACCRVQSGTIDCLAQGNMFDTILYIDVLEHIADDRTELRQAVRHLQAGGHLIILSPSHNWLYSPFDAAVGHHRRYSRKTLRRVLPEGMEEIELIYLDSVGMLASIANKWLLRNPYPSRRQIMIWDRIMITMSRFLDPCLGYRFGKSILGVWVLNR